MEEKPPAVIVEDFMGEKIIYSVEGKFVCSALDLSSVSLKKLWGKIEEKKIEEKIIGSFVPFDALITNSGSVGGKLQEITVVSPLKRMRFNYKIKGEEKLREGWEQDLMVACDENRQIFAEADALSKVARELQAEIAEVWKRVSSAQSQIQYMNKRS